MSGYTASGMSLAEGNEGTWTTRGNNGVWEGEANFVDFKINQQVRYTTIIVTLLPEEVPYLRGDVDNSGEVGISDVTALVDYLLNRDDSAINLNAADCDENGAVEIADVTTLVDYILNKVW